MDETDRIIEEDLCRHTGHKYTPLYNPMFGGALWGLAFCRQCGKTIKVETTPADSVPSKAA